MENVSLHRYSHVILRGKVMAHCIYPFPEPIAVTSAAFPRPFRPSDVGGVISSHHGGRRIFAIIVWQFCPVFAMGGLRALQTNHGISYIHFSYRYSLFCQLRWCYVDLTGPTPLVHSSNGSPIQGHSFFSAI